MSIHKLISRVAPLAALLLVASGCSGDDSGSPTDPPPTTSVVETFTNTLTLNGAHTFSFSVTGIGGITAHLVKLEPDSAGPVGLLVGTWNGSICQHVPGLSLDNAKQGDVVLAATQTLGDYCVRIYDAAGTVTEPQLFVIEVTHEVAQP